MDESKIVGINPRTRSKAESTSDSEDLGGNQHGLILMSLRIREASIGGKYLALTFLLRLCIKAVQATSNSSQKVDSEDAGEHHK